MPIISHIMIDLNQSKLHDATSMKLHTLRRRIQDITSRRFICFLLGIAAVPILSFAKSLVFPTAKDAMGFVGFYEEHLSLYTFLGDHTYSLKFPGDRKEFERVARKLGLAEHRMSENEYLKKDPKGQWSQRLLFDETTKLTSIQFYSESS